MKKTIISILLVLSILMTLAMGGLPMVSAEVDGVTEITSLQTNFLDNPWEFPLMAFDSVGKWSPTL